MTELDQAFAEYNRRYFRNELPTIRVVWGRLPKDNLALFQWREPGGADGIITLSPRLKFSSRIWQATLLHEMVHLKLCDHPSHEETDAAKMHGKAWLAEMRRLVDAGAMDELF